MVGGGPADLRFRVISSWSYCPGHMRTNNRLLTAQGLGLLLLSLPFAGSGIFLLCLS